MRAAPRAARPFGSRAGEHLAVRETDPGAAPGHPAATGGARRRTRAVGHRRLRRRCARRGLPRLPQPRSDRLRPARDRTLGGVALPWARAGQPAERRHRGGRVRTPARAAAGVLHEPRLGGGHRAAPSGPRGGADRAVRDLVRHQGRARVRARPPRQDRAAGARLRGGGGWTRLPVPRQPRFRASRAQGRLPQWLPGVHPRSGFGPPAPGAAYEHVAATWPPRGPGRACPHCDDGPRRPLRRASGRRLRPLAPGRLSGCRPLGPGRRRCTDAAAAPAGVRGGRHPARPA